uniref:uncharacterized protein LOC105353096 n=1 Tax=Fragaria vesca subsp. vesca TaxID=101020 RepID=UPI0005C8371D|nr:PREDICTED: uncharacterized protein LOC105353096 [Fragaria vesca subsp. vesca]
MGLVFSGPVLTRSQRQDELVKMCPDGIAKVVRRPKTNPDGSEIVCITEYEFPEWQCDSLMNRFWEAIREGETWNAKFYGSVLPEHCGIEVDINKAIDNRIKKNKAKDNSSATPPS